MSCSKLPLPGAWLTNPDQLHSAFIRILQDLADEGSALSLTDKRAVSKLLQQRIRYHAKLSPAESSPPEEQFAKRYDFIVSDLVRRKVMPGDYDSDSDDEAQIDDMIQFNMSSNSGIRYWHLNEGNNQSKTGASSKTRYTSFAPKTTFAAEEGGNPAYGKSNGSTLQYRPEITPHMNATGKFPAYYPQVCNMYWEQQ
jgi:hypothetical protein